MLRLEDSASQNAGRRCSKASACSEPGGWPAFSALLIAARPVAQECGCTSAATRLSPNQIRCRTASDSQVSTLILRGSSTGQPYVMSGIEFTIHTVFLPWIGWRQKVAL